MGRISVPNILISWYNKTRGETSLETDWPEGYKIGRRKLVTVLDKATGKTQNVAMIDYFDANAKAQWKPLFDQLKERMAELPQPVRDAINSADVTKRVGSGITTMSD